MRFVSPIALAAFLLVVSATPAANVAAGSPPPAPTAAPRFTITELFPPSDAGSMQAVALNDRGQVVVSWYDPANGGGSFLWERGKTPRVLGTLGNGYRLEPLALNNAGQIVGIARANNDPSYRKQRAFLWENGTAHDLGTPAGETSEALSINNRGQVFVTSFAFNDQVLPTLITKTSAFVWTAAKGFQSLPKRFEQYGITCTINDRGQIVGTGTITPDESQSSFAGLSREEMPDMDGVFASRAFLYENGAFHRLPIPNSWSTQAQALNNRGDALLSAGLLAKSGRDTVVRWGNLYLWRNGQVTAITDHSGGSLTVGMLGTSALNDAGDVVGSIYSGSNQARQYHAFLYRAGKLYRLDNCLPANSGWHLTAARQINNRGQIAGTGTFHGKMRAFLLTPQ